jgi:hypothetical protein
MKRLISLDVQARIARKLLLNEPELIEQALQKNLLLEEPMNGYDAMAWLNKVGDSDKGFNRAYTLQRICSSTDGSMVYGVFERDGKWYKSSFKTGRLYFRFWGTDVGCIANVPEDDLCNLLHRFDATTYTHFKAEFRSVLRKDDNNNAFFSWKASRCYGCIRHKPINTDDSEPLVDSVFRIEMQNEDFLEIINPYLVKLE